LLLLDYCQRGVTLNELYDKRACLVEQEVTKLLPCPSLKVSLVLANSEFRRIALVLLPYRRSLLGANVDADAAIPRLPLPLCHTVRLLTPRLFLIDIAGKGGKNRRRGKGDGEESKRELEFKEDGA
jgi:hypothetical protein